jgi:hypothetical protein
MAVLFICILNISNFGCQEAKGLWEKIQARQGLNKWRPDLEEEYEDQEGNIYNKKGPLLLKCSGFVWNNFYQDSCCVFGCIRLLAVWHTLHGVRWYDGACVLFLVDMVVRTVLSSSYDNVSNIVSWIKLRLRLLLLVCPTSCQIRLTIRKTVSIFNMRVQ